MMIPLSRYLVVSVGVALKTMLAIFVKIGEAKIMQFDLRRHFVVHGWFKKNWSHHSYENSLRYNSPLTECKRKAWFTRHILGLPNPASQWNLAYPKRMGVQSWLVLSDEQMSNWLGVEHQPEKVSPFKHGYLEEFCLKPSPSCRIGPTNPPN